MRVNQIEKKIISNIDKTLKFITVIGGISFGFVIATGLVVIVSKIL